MGRLRRSLAGPTGNALGTHGPPDSDVDLEKSRRLIRVQIQICLLSDLSEPNC